MKIELKHIAPYLPYDLRIFHSAFMFRNNWNENEIGTMVGICDVVELPVLGETTFDIVTRRDKDFYKLHDSRCHFKPILRPLSDLTKEIEAYGKKFIPIDFINCEFSSEIPRKIEWNQSVKNENLHFILSEWVSPEYLYGLFELLFKWHFDVFGLIKKDLAIDINTLNK